MQNLTLVILAAGMGSRFGGLKQIEPVGPNGEFLIDYSIYDAIKAGFKKIVFIIKPENYEIFKETIGQRIENKIPVEYAFQDMDEARGKYNLPIERVKPLGTTHAILCAKKFIDGPFVIINADDFYGYEAYQDAVNLLKETNYEQNGAVLYKIANTLTDNGAVKRGICTIANSCLEKAIECNVEKENGKIIATPLSKGESFKVATDNATSMNMFVLLPQTLNLLEEVFNDFMEENKNNLEKCEALIIEDLFKLVERKQITLKTKLTNAKWFGVTYKEDKGQVVENIKELIKQNIYPQNLWH